MVERDYSNFRVLVIGAGRAGVRHAEAQRKLGAQVALTDINKRLAFKKAYEIGVDVIEEPEMGISKANLVVIATSAPSHFQVAKQVIDQGKDIFCEKPMTTNLKDAEDLERSVIDAGVNFIVGNYVRLESTFTTMRRMVVGKEMGRVLSMEGAYIQDVKEAMQLTPWRKEVGVLWDGGVHPVDLVTWMGEEPIESVMAVSGIKIIPDYPHPEDLRLTLTDRSGRVSPVWVNAHGVADIGVGFMVHTEGGFITAQHTWDQLQIYKGGVTSSKWVPRVKRPIDRAAVVVNEYLVGERNDHRPLPDIHEAMQVIRILDAAERSMESGLKIKI